jgi:uncharacterized membrane protein YedE/YeeE
MRTDFTLPIIPIFVGAVISSLILSLLLRRLNGKRKIDDSLHSPQFFVILSIGVFFLISSWTIMIAGAHPALWIWIVIILLIAFFLATLIGALIIPS